MPLPIEDYAFLSDLESAALVGKDGSVDWLTFPRFDSPACFAALLGGPEHGRWLIAPTGGVRSVTRRYLDRSLILETTFTTDDGVVTITDCMPPRDQHLEIIRLVQGIKGRVPMHLELIVRFDYGSIVPWVRRLPDGSMQAVGGPDSLRLFSPVEIHGENLTSVADFTVAEGDDVPFTLSWHPAHEMSREHVDPVGEIAAAHRWWQRWNSRDVNLGEWDNEVVESLTILKGLTYAPTGGLVAAATTSLPEQFGGPRNWDYRYCWLRDATYTLLALIAAGHRQEAMAWRDWLLRAVAGSPQQLQIMYGLSGERRLTEFEVPWLPGYLGCSPVRVGNAASTQFQLDVYGEVLDALHQAALAGMPFDENGWELQKALLDFLEDCWTKPDEGIWEVRGPRRQFTHSKVMAWVAADRAVRTVEHLGADGPVDRWRALRDDIKAWVLGNCVDDHGVLVQHKDGSDLDASLLMVPLVGFLEPNHEVVENTIAAIERELMVEGFVVRYLTRESLDGLPPGEGAFLLCTFWLAQAKAMRGQHDEARAIFERLLGLRNDVGLLAEEYDPAAGRALGNVPQAFSHTALVNTALALAGVATRTTGSAAPVTNRRPKGKIS